MRVMCEASEYRPLRTLIIGITYRIIRTFLSTRMYKVINKLITFIDNHLNHVDVNLALILICFFFKLKFINFFKWYLFLYKSREIYYILIQYKYVRYSTFYALISNF